MSIAKLLLLITFLSISLSLFAAPPADNEKLDKRFNDMDTDHDGTIDRAEFRAMMDKRFDEMDTNHDGTLTKEEMLNYRHLMQKERAAKAPNE